MLIEYSRIALDLAPGFGSITSTRSIIPILAEPAGRIIGTARRAYRIAVTIRTRLEVSDTVTTRTRALAAPAVSIGMLM